MIVRRSFILLASIMVTGCASDALKPPRADDALLEFKPLAGTWRAAVAKPGERIAWTEETWSIPTGDSMIGTSRTLRHGDWSHGEFEFLRIVARPDGVFYLASPDGRMPPTEFRYEHHWICGGAGPWPFPFPLPAGKYMPRFEFVNEAHDFPQRIVYEFESDDEMQVTISGPGAVTGDGAAAPVRTESWHFERAR